MLITNDDKSINSKWQYHRYHLPFFTTAKITITHSLKLNETRFFASLDLWQVLSLARMQCSISITPWLEGKRRARGTPPLSPVRETGWGIQTNRGVVKKRAICLAADGGGRKSQVDPLTSLFVNGLLRRGIESASVCYYIECITGAVLMCSRARQPLAQHCYWQTCRLL